MTEDIKTIIMPPVPPIVEKLSDIDKLTLDLAKQKRQTVLSEAKAALAQNEKEEVSFRYLVLQMYVKYHLDENDAIDENGVIIRGGAAQAQAQAQQQGR